MIYLYPVILSIIYTYISTTSTSMNTLYIICHCACTYMSVAIHFSQSNQLLHCTHFIFFHLTQHLFSICEFYPKKYQTSKTWSRTKANCNLVGHTTRYPTHHSRKPSGQRSWKFAAALTVSWLRRPLLCQVFSNLQKCQRRFTRIMGVSMFWQEAQMPDIKRYFLRSVMTPRIEVIHGVKGPFVGP